MYKRTKGDLKWSHKWDLKTYDSEPQKVAAGSINEKPGRIHNLVPKA